MTAFQPGPLRSGVSMSSGVGAAAPPTKRSLPCPCSCSVLALLIHHVRNPPATCFPSPEPRTTMPPAQRASAKRAAAATPAIAPAASASPAAAPAPFVVKLPATAGADQVSMVSASSKPRRPKKTKRVQNDSDEESDNASVVACVDDRQGGSVVAKRAAVLAQAETARKATPSAQAEGSVSKRALKRGVMKAKEERAKARGDLRTVIAQDTGQPSTPELSDASPSSNACRPSKKSAQPVPKSSSPSAATPPHIPVEVRVPTSTVVSTSSCQPSASTTATPQMEEPREICRDFKKFVACPFGSACIHLHILPVSQNST
jgi:hypothetical protein